MNCFKPGVPLALLVCLIAPAHGATIMFLSQTAVFDPASNLVTFTIQFNRPPDFLTTDTVGRLADSFQYFITGDPALGYPAEYESIVRVGEIPDALRIRNAVPSVPDPLAGGWGAIQMSYHLSSRVHYFAFPPRSRLLATTAPMGCSVIDWRRTRSVG